MARIDRLRLQQALTYNPSTGVFRWAIRSGHSRPGEVAGNIRRDGYRQIGVDGTDYLAHRLAWFFIFGEWPPDGVDHINGVKDDNRIANLRPATQSQNLQNIHRQRASRSGLTGVSRNKQRWRARIHVGGVEHHLGTFDTPDEASATYQRAKRELHPFMEGVQGYGQDQD